MSSQEQFVSLTGITGYVGAEVARQLLKKGYTVRGVVRNGTSEARKEALKRDLIEGASVTTDKLELVEADITNVKEMEEVIRGSVYFFHIASPFTFTITDPYKDVIDPAVNGTKAVLTAAGKHKNTLRRVVLTSSVAAVHDKGHTQQPRAGSGLRYTEEDWNATSRVEQEYYWVSKVEAERAAWELARDAGLELATICPNFVLGPAASSAAAAGVSVGFMTSILAGGEKPLEGSWTLVDVREVAAAHVAAAEVPAAAGQRFILSLPRSVSAREVTDAIKAALPADLASQIPDGIAAKPEELVDGTKATLVLGVRYRPVEETLADMARSLLQLRLTP